jgi:hypothetical protein
MIIETKYNLGDCVYPIWITGDYKWIPCKSCDSTGQIKLADGEEVPCPKCYGRKGEKVWQSDKWNVITQGFGTIGKIEPCVYLSEYYGKNRITYMLDSTGVGSGTVYYEENLFLTKEEAQIECDRKNELGIKV